MATQSDVLRLLRSSKWLSDGTKQKNLTRHLRSVAKGDDRILASRAVYLASRFKTKGCIDIVKEAASSRLNNLRIAAASVASELPRKDAIEVVKKLLGSKVSTIRKRALESAESLDSPELLPKLKSMSKNEPIYKLKRQAKELAKRLAEKE